MGIAFLALAAVQGAAPPPPTPPPENLETIVVTGERAKRSLKDTPSSVAVFDKRDIEKMAAVDRIQQLLELVPNVLQTSTRDTPVIRGQVSAGELAGLPAFLGGARPRTIVQVDGRTITFNEFANSSQGLWDVDRVEVFRSPQTTTQGANSIGGAIFMYTADPTWHPDGHVRAVLGEFNRRQLSGAASAPLIGDQLALRFAGDLYWGRAANKMVGPVEGVDLNKDQYGTARLKLLAQPKGLPGLKILMTLSHVGSEAPQGETAQRPFSERKDIPCICGYFRDTVNSVTTLVTYAVTNTLESRTTLDWGKTFFRRFAVEGFGQTHIHGRDRSLESLLQWKPTGTIEAVGGVAFQGMDLDQSIDLSATPFGTGTFNDRQDSAGIFGDATWHPATRLSLIAGVRYQADRKRRTGVLRETRDLPLDFDRTDRALLPKLSAAYDLSSNVRLGLLVQRAYNPGGVTLDPDQFTVITFKPEFLWDYEAYTRASFFGGALSVTGNLFYNSIRDAQRTLDICVEATLGCVGLVEVSNAPRAHTSGAELEASARPGQRLTFRGGLGVLHSRVTRTLTADDPILGKEFLGSPHFTGFVAADWEPLRDLQLSAQIRHYGGYFNDNAEFKQTRLQPSTIVDARASWTVRRFTMFAYAQNLFDQLRITGWGGPPDDPATEVFTNDPREIGVGIEARF